MDSLNKIAMDSRTWLGILALALTIAAELLTEADGFRGKPSSFVEREQARRAEQNIQRFQR